MISFNILLISFVCAQYQSRYILTHYINLYYDNTQMGYSSNNRCDLQCMLWQSRRAYKMESYGILCYWMSVISDYFSICMIQILSLSLLSSCPTSSGLSIQPSNSYKKHNEFWLVSQHAESLKPDSQLIKNGPENSRIPIGFASEIS